ncbi:MAG TPA: MFS transporter [Anaerolineae bacterium]|nr:MFS transporter [Anaerolineae bacterium]
MEKLKAYRVFLAMSAAQAFAMTAMFTTGTVYYVNGIGLDPLQLVLVGTALEATAFLFEIPTGIVADVYSRRLSILLGHFLLGAGFLLIGAFPLFDVLLAAQVITGIGYTFLSGATEAWLADEIGEVHVGAALIRARQLERITSIAGILAGAGLASLRLNLPFLAGGGLLLALGAFLVWHMPETGFRPASREDRSTWSKFAGAFREGARLVRASRLLLLFFGIAFFWGAASEGFDRLGDAHLLASFAFPAIGALQPVAWFGVLALAGTLIELAVNELLRKRLEAITRVPSATAKVLFVINALMIASVLVFALAGGFWLALSAMLLYGVCRSMGGPLIDAWLVQHIDSSVRATVLSMRGQTDAIGQIAGGPGVGWIGRAVSLRAAIAAAGLLLSPALILYARTIRHTREMLTRDALEEPKLIETMEATTS